MSPLQLEELYRPAFSAATHIAAQGEGSKYAITIVCDSFAGQRPVARQQAVYAVVSQYIATGEIHALTIKAYTADEWRKAQLFGA
jgi:acid stress-induced BolA-like protein IbaG/YrbA